MITDHQPIVKECIGCEYVLERIVGGRTLICSRHPYPKIKWQFFSCEDATHFNKKLVEHPEEGRYDSRGR